jgi:hypothetical protein
MVDDRNETKGTAEKRCEPRRPPETYTSAEFRMNTVKCLFQSRVWNFSSQGMCLLLKEDSSVLESLEIGKELEVKYYPADSSRPPETRKTRIAHITRESEGKFKNHFLIGLRIVEALEEVETRATTLA